MGLRGSPWRPMVPDGRLWVPMGPMEFHGLRWVGGVCGGWVLWGEGLGSRRMNHNGHPLRMHVGSDLILRIF